MLKFGIIGCGVIAPYHAMAIENAKGAELFAVCDIIESKAVKFAGEFKAKKIHTDYLEMLKDSEIDAVCICTPSGMHGEMAVNAAKAGKHILCEKPIEITHEKLEHMIAEISKSGVKAGCVFQRRMYPPFMRVKETLDSGVFGKVLIADTYLKYYRSAEYYKSAGWRATWELDGGGALMNQGIHGIDLINWFMGGIESVNSLVRTQLHDIKVEDTALSLVKFKNGAVGVIEGTTCVNPSQSSRFEIHCEKGSIIVDDSGIISWCLENKELKDQQLTAPEGFSAKNDPTAIGKLSHLTIVEDLVDSIINDRKPFVTPSEGREAVDIILAIYRSSAENREIKP